MADKICLVLHRKSANDPGVKDAVARVRDQGVKLRVRIPWNKKDKPRVVKEALADGATRIVAGGGDGTVNAVAHALVGKGKKKKPKAVLGILPLGTANDFARGLDLPLDDLPACLLLACTGEARRIDVGRANGRSFVNAVSGAVGEAIETLRSRGDDGDGVKRSLDGARALLQASGTRSWKGRLRVPGETPTEEELLGVVVLNGRTAAGGWELAPEAELDDGALDLLLLRPDDSARRRVSSFTLQAKEGVRYLLDGEAVVAPKLHVSVLPQRLGVVF